MAYLAAEASRELLEETGIHREPDTLALWAVSEGTHQNIGVCFRAVETGAVDVTAVRRFIGAQSDAEFSEVATVRTAAEAAKLGEGVDYLPHCLDLI